jgi:hypothetical protein
MGLPSSETGCRTIDTLLCAAGNSLIFPCATGGDAYADGEGDADAEGVDRSLRPQHHRRHVHCSSFLSAHCSTKQAD